MIFVTQNLSVDECGQFDSEVRRQERVHFVIHYL